MAARQVLASQTMQNVDGCFRMMDLVFVQMLSGEICERDVSVGRSGSNAALPPPS
jgi:hypothetical protein